MNLLSNSDKFALKYKFIASSAAIEGFKISQNLLKSVQISAILGDSFIHFTKLYFNWAILHKSY